MKSKWFIEQNKFATLKGRIWYDKYYFLETGVSSPAFGFQISWLSWAYGVTVQKGY
jgi:hypothetical protein